MIDLGNDVLQGFGGGRSRIVQTELGRTAYRGDRVAYAMRDRRAQLSDGREAFRLDQPVVLVANGPIGPADDPEERGVQQQTGHEPERPDEPRALGYGVEKPGRDAIQLGYADHGIPPAISQRHVKLDELHWTLTQMRALGLGVVRARDAHLVFQVSAQRVLELRVGGHLPRDFHLGIARPDYFPIGGVDVRTQHVRQARYMREELFEVAVAEIGKASFAVGDLVLHIGDALQELHRQHGVPMHHMLRKEIRNQQRAHAEHERDAEQAEQ